MKLKVVCAMSGGVDSSVAAALLQEAGFTVSGIFLRLNKAALVHEKRAQTVAKILKIPLTVIDLRPAFKSKVVDCFLKESKEGLTPNPCVVCNKEIKFGLLLKESLKLGADFLATGHYVKSNRYDIKLGAIKDPDVVRLLKGKDKLKDQSYFLWQLNQKQLKHVLFPLGDHTRSQVETLAKKYKLPLFAKSQETCFAQDQIEEFLKDNLKLNPGNIVDGKGELLGQHLGLYFYTLGQRKGIGLSGGPYWVKAKDLKQNTLIVTKKEGDLLAKSLLADKVNWVAGEVPKLPLIVKAKIRYNQAAFKAQLEKDKGGKIRVVFSRAQRAVTKGQSVVFYQGAEVLGGGVIIA